MSTAAFDRDSMARWYAREHLQTDPGIVDIWYLPTGADEREIRFVEVNNVMAERTDDYLEPIDFGVDMGTENAHKLFVLDVTPAQWERIQKGELNLPDNWTLDSKVSLQK